jgi:uncharacterized membrane protein
MLATRILPLDAPPPRPVGTVYMDATLRPARSLDARGLKVIMLAMMAVCTAVGLVFWSLGAWPVVGFLGLDIALIWLAFRAHARSGARERELVTVTAERIQITHADHKGRERWWATSPQFARVELDTPDPLEASVALAAGPDRLALARYLSPPERKRFARALDGAIQRARAERHPAG